MTVMLRNAPNPLIDPVTLEVLRNALESIADEMGAVLKRTAFSPNIKERMDASCAIFDAAAQLVAQAEHVPVHLGLDAALGRSHDRRGRDGRGGRRRHRQRPVHRRLAPARHHARRAGLCRRRAYRLCRDAGAPRRCRRHGAGLDAGQQPRDLPGGAGHPGGQALPARRIAGGCAAHDPRQCAHPDRAARRSQRAARRIAGRRTAPRRAGRPLRRRPGHRRLRGDPRLCRAPHAPPPRRAAARHLPGRGFSRRRRQQRRAGAGHSRDHRVARPAGARFRRLLGAAPRQHQRGRADDLFGGVLRGEDPDRSGNPGECRHLSQRRAEAAGRQLPRGADARRGVRRQYRDDAARRRYGAQGLRAIRPRPGAGGEPGHDEPDRHRRARPSGQGNSRGGPTPISRRSAAARAAARWGRATTASSAT